MIACGGKITSAFLQMMRSPLSEAIAYLEVYLSVQTKNNPQARANSAEGKMAAWGLTLDDFEM